MALPSVQRECAVPLLAPRCVVCGGDAHEVLCTAAEVQRQLDYLQRFHRRRLKASPRADALADRAEFSRHELTDIVRCSSCGQVFREERPRAEAAVEEYAEDRYGPERLAALFESQLELFRTKLDPLAQHLSERRPPCVIEIGSFVGGFLAAARERGWQAVGVDPGEAVVGFCRGKGLTVHRGTADDAPIAAGSADGVVIWNTFDQLPEPRPTLTAARRWLRRDGVLAVRVPNGPGFAAALTALRALTPALSAPLRAAMAWNNLLAFPYLQGYSVETLDRLLARFDLRRLAAAPDTLPRLADTDTKAWAAAEEWSLKTAWRAAAHLAPRLAPWVDAYYRVEA